MIFSQYFKKWSEAYYSSQNFQNKKIGKGGDFFTAVSVGPLFGTLLAKHFLKLIDTGALKTPLSLCEIGANDGALSLDFLKAILEFRPELFGELNFFIIEPYENLQKMQKKSLKDVDFSHKRSLKECEFENAFFFCNELFDCLPCELIANEKMAFIENGKIIFKKMDEGTKKLCKNLGLKKGELQTGLLDLLKELNGHCENFIFAGFDYGSYEDEAFSLRGYQGHKIIDPFEISLNDFFGKIDLTYNLNFSQLKYFLEQNKMNLINLKKQSQALLDFGFEELMEWVKNKDEKLFEDLLRQSKILLFSFDEKFHFFEFEKNKITRKLG